MMIQKKTDSSCFINRELSWLKFNKRVLEEASTKETPLFERLRFFGIYVSNLDEFFMVRVGSLYEKLHLTGDAPDDKTGMTICKQLEAVYEDTHKLLPLQATVYGELKKEFSPQGVTQINFKKLSKEKYQHIERSFAYEIMPLLSPQVFKLKSPFPHLANDALYVVLSLKPSGKQKQSYAIIPVPDFLPKIFFPFFENEYYLIEDVIYEFADRLFPGQDILEKSVMKITRNADVTVDEGIYDDDVDYMELMKEALKRRTRLQPVRMMLSAPLKDDTLGYFLNKLELQEKHVYYASFPLRLDFLPVLEARLRRQGKDMFYKQLIPQRLPDIKNDFNIMDEAARRDIFFYYPFDSMAHLLSMLRQAANHPDVVSIKITLYRVAHGSKVVDALIEAAENSKEVTVFVELKARFDEENNILLATRLEQAGCNVIYGVEDLKVHSKVLLICMRSPETHYITHIGTGNYNEDTAKLYTDANIITSDPEMAVDAVHFFQSLATSVPHNAYKSLLVSPYGISKGFMELVDDEIRNQKEFSNGRVILKFNSLTDKLFCDKLIAASMAGVKIDLIVRGVCCLLSGIKGMTDNIRITSIVGRYLEHSRIFYFHANGEEKMYIASADLMTRNTERRIEVAAPVKSATIKNKMKHILDVLLSDNVKARIQQDNGEYIYRERDSAAIDSQLVLFEEAYNRSEN